MAETEQTTHEERKKIFFDDGIDIDKQELTLTYKYEDIESLNWSEFIERANDLATKFGLRVA